MTLPQIKSLELPQLQRRMQEMGQPAFRAGQVFGFLHRGVTSFDEMTNLPKALRQQLAEEYLLTVPELERKQCSKLDGTVKYLWRLHDGNTVESVLMRYSYGASLCVSTQVGCRMGCTFCASTLGGLVRNLEAGEILDQVLFAQKESSLRISHIVLMGIGEPLDNYEQVVRFLRLVSHPDGLQISLRHISLSTCGLVDEIDRLAGEKLPITLSVSLHCPDNEGRSRIMPVNRRYPLEELMRACRDYFRQTGRRISYEYAMIAGVNDAPEQAQRLAQLLKGQPAHVNLIPLNPVAERHLRGSSRAQIQRFAGILEQQGVTVTVRRRLGPDIDASCGQLRRRRIQEEGMQE